MKPKQITYGRKFNLGANRFESATLEITADIEDGETATEVFEKLKKFVESKRPDNSNNANTLNQRNQSSERN